MFQPQLTALARRFLLAIQELKNAIDKQTETIHSKEEKTTQEQHPLPEMRAEIHFPESVERASTEQKGKEYRLQKWNVRISALTFFVVAVSAAIFAWQLAALRESNRISRKSLQSAQRAFVFYSPQGITPSWVTDKVGSTKIIAWTFFVPRKNSGTTPTRSLKEHIDISYGPEPPSEDFNFHDFEGGVSGPANPQEPTYYQTKRIPAEILKQAEEGAQHIYVYGWLSYYDVFEGTPQRVSKFCFEIYPLSGDFTTTKGGPYGTQAALCTTREGTKALHNCSDADCEAQNPT